MTMTMQGEGWRWRWREQALTDKLRLLKFVLAAWHIKVSLREHTLSLSVYRHSCLQLELSPSLTSSLHLLSVVCWLFGFALLSILILPLTFICLAIFHLFKKHNNFRIFFWALRIWLLALAKLGVCSFVPHTGSRSECRRRNSMGRIHEPSARLLLFYFGLSLLSCLLFFMAVCA